MENSGFNPQEKFVKQVRTNTKSDLIEITEDKLENILLKHLQKLSKINAWLTPVSLFATVIIVLLTSNFKDFLDIKKEVWEALFVLISIVTLIWSVVAIFQSIKCSKKASIKFLISEIKNQTE